jgi:hypothetical protein
MSKKAPIRWVTAIWVALGLVCLAIDYRLPARSVFPGSMPRYPNLWFYVDRTLVEDYASAVKLVTEEMRKDMGLTENHSEGRERGPDGSDFEARVGGLQPVQGHAHVFEIRYYYSALARENVHETEVAGVRYYRLAASAHYKPEQPNLPGVEGCPICGRSGWYAKEHGDLLERVQDPLGLELATVGRVRDSAVMLPGGKRMDSICNLLKTFMPAEAWMNTQRIGIVVLRKGWEGEKRKCVEDID